MYCIKCGKELPDKARFCSKCGTPTGIQPVQNEESPQPVKINVEEKTSDASMAAKQTNEAVPEAVEQIDEAAPAPVEQTNETAPAPAEQINEAVPAQTPTISCKSCGKQLTEGIKFCSKCGTPTDSKYAQPTAAPTRQFQQQAQQTQVNSQTSTTQYVGEAAAKPKKKKGWLIALVIILVILSILSAIIAPAYINENKKTTAFAVYDFPELIITMPNDLTLTDESTSSTTICTGKNDAIKFSYQSTGVNDGITTEDVMDSFIETYNSGDQGFDEMIYSDSSSLKCYWHDIAGLQYYMEMRAYVENGHAVILCFICFHTSDYKDEFSKWLDSVEFK